MFHLDNGSGIDTMPTLANKQSSSVKWFTEGDNKNSPSYPGQDWFNMMQAEMLNILTAAKITPDKTKLNQVTLAIQQLIKDKTPAASLAAAGVVQLDSSINSTAENKAATPKAVKDLNDITIKKNQNISIEKSTPLMNMYNLNSHGLSLKLTDSNAVEFLYKNDAGWSRKARYTESSNTLNFENLDRLCFNGINLVSAGEHGLGGQAINYGTSSYNIDLFTTPTQFGWYNKNAIGDLPSANSGFLLNFNIINQNLLQIASDYINNELYMRHARSLAWKSWIKIITTQNISNYIQNKIIAWGRFDYSTNDAINIIASNGISSITRTATGKYAITLSDEITDAKYVVNCNSQQLLEEGATFANTCVPMHLSSQMFEIWCGDNNQDKFYDTGNCYFTVVTKS